MTQIEPLPPIEAAARQEYEYYGSTLTTNTFLKIALLIAMGVIGLLGYTVKQTAIAAANQKPLVIRVNEVGRADALAYSGFVYKPQAPEVRYFLTQFVVGFYGRNRQTVAEKYVNSLYFLDRSVFNQIDARDRKTQWLPKFLTSAEDNQDIVVRNVVIEDLTAAPYKARVEFSKVFTNTAGLESRRENWSASFHFRFNPNVPNELVQHNPLGLDILYFREDQAFTN